MNLSVGPVNIRATDESRGLLTLEELDGREPVTRTVAIAASLSVLEQRVKFARVEIDRQRKQVAKDREALVDAVADVDVSPAHDVDRRRRLASGRRKALTISEDQLSDLIAFEDACLEEMERIVGEYRQAAE